MPHNEGYMEGELCLSHANDEFKKRIQAGEKRHAGLFDIAIESGVRISLDAEPKPQA
jgi:hypothetical protein